jgi:hypothetical protein
MTLLKSFYCIWCPKYFLFKVVYFFEIINDHFYDFFGNFVFWDTEIYWIYDVDLGVESEWILKVFRNITKISISHVTNTERFINTHYSREK